jgi:hypothetical protein
MITVTLLQADFGFEAGYQSGNACILDVNDSNLGRDVRGM